jgi:PGF-CTERM protein
MVGADGDGPEHRFGTVNIGGITWTEDIRVTRNGAADKVPQVSVDAAHDAHIMWQSARAGGSGYYYVKLNRAGEFLSQETFISNKVLMSWGDSYPLGPTMDIDSQNNLHITFDDGWQNIKYMKFDEQGNVLVPEKNVGPNDADASHTPSIAVGTDDTVHFSHEEYKFQCEDIAYDKLDNNGQDIWITRVVSSDVASHCEFSLIKADRYNGNMLFTFGSATGTWLGRYNKFGVKDMPSVKIRTDSDLKVADVASTPDGTMHVVWSDNGKVWYTRVNASGFKTLDKVELSSSTVVNPGFPRVAATSDNRAVVVWDDARAGAKEVYFAVIDNSPVEPGTWVAPPNVRLTDADGRESKAPWIAIDPDDNFHVVWVDSRDGNEEVYYKFAFNFALELYADPIDYANMIFMHPNETKVLPMTLRNKGGLPDGYDISLSYTQGADQVGWRAKIDLSFVEELGSLESVPINLTVHSPANAKDNDNISITVNASSTTAPTEYDDISLNIYVKVTRGVKLGVDQSTKFGDNGETVAYNMIVQNTGDVRENQINLENVVGQGPQDWPIWLDKTHVALDSKESTNFTVYIGVPETAPGATPQIFGIHAWSSVDSAAQDLISITVGVKAAFLIQMKSEPPQLSVDPGDTATYTIEVTNVGNLASQVEIGVETQDPSSSMPGFSAVLDSQFVFLRGGESTTIHLSVAVPTNAVADTRLTLVVQGFAAKYGTEGRVEVSTFVNRVQSLDIQAGSGGLARVGRSVDYEMTISNNGNGDESLQLSEFFLPSAAWTMQFLDGPATVAGVFVPHGQSKKVTVRVTVGPDALAGTHRPTVAVIDEYGSQHLVALTTNVQQFYALDLTATEFKLDGSPGGLLEYDLQVANNGNGLDNVTMTTDDLPPNFDTRWYVVTVDTNTGAEERTPIETVLLVAPHRFHNLKLIVTVPLTTTASTVSFSARATSQAQEEDPVILVADIKKADLRFGVVTFTPNDPAPGRITAITVEVQNGGEFDAQPVIVEFRDNGQYIATEKLFRVASHAKGFVTFAWLPTAGTHDLEFRVDPCGQVDQTECIVESDEDNNVATQSKPVGGTTGLPGFEAPFALAGLLAVALVATMRRRRDA